MDTRTLIVYKALFRKMLTFGSFTEMKQCKNFIGRIITTKLPYEKDISQMPQNI